MQNRDLVTRLRDSLVHDYAVDRERISVVFAPYRICPLGAHIDHQLGRVTAMALDQGVFLAFAPWSAREVRMRSLAFPGEVHCPLDQVPNRKKDDWGNYLRGAMRGLQEHFQLNTGLVGITAGKVSEGGLSSSAAVGVAYLLALEKVNELNVSLEQNIALDQYIENAYLGLRNGILDQSAILLSRKDQLTLIDCASTDYQRIAKPSKMASFSILIVFSGLRKTLVGTDYNRRVAECTEAARLLLHATGQGKERPLLRNVAPEQYMANRHLLSGATARRAEHFFSEMRRVTDGVDAWRRGDLVEFGRLITASGASSIDNYECGAPPLIDLYHLLIESAGVHGARFSGAGFRGCCLALVRPDRAEAIGAQVRRRYIEKHPELSDCCWALPCQSANGASIIA